MAAAHRWRIAGHARFESGHDQCWCTVRRDHQHGESLERRCGIAGEVAHVGAESEQHCVEASVVDRVARGGESRSVGGWSDELRLKGVAGTKAWGRGVVGGSNLGASVTHAPSSVVAGLVAGGTGRSSSPARIACPRSKSARYGMARTAPAAIRLARPSGSSC